MDHAPGERRQRAMVASRRKRRRAFTILAVLFALASVGILALTPRATIQVPVIGEVHGDVELRFAFTFPDQADPPLERPVGVVVAGDRVYVVDSAAAVVRVYDDRGVERDVVGAGVLDVPVYAAVDAERGVLYVTDRAKGVLFLFGLDDGALVGTLEPVAPEGSTVATAWAPLAIDVQETGALVVSDILDRHRVLLLEPDGRIIREIAGAQADVASAGVGVVLDFPNAVRGTGDEVWVADSNNKRALVFGRDGDFRRVVPTRGLVRGFDFVPPVAGATETTLVAFTDTLGGGILLMDMEGESFGRFGGPGSSEGALAFPNDVSVDGERGRIFVADTGNRRVQVWDVSPASEGDGALFQPGDALSRDLFRWVAVIAGALSLLLALGALRARRLSGGTDSAGVDTE